LLFDVLMLLSAQLLVGVAALCPIHCTTVVNF